MANDMRAGLAEAFAKVAQTMSLPSTTEETLTAMVGAAGRTVSGLPHVGVTVVGRSHAAQTMAATDQFVSELDQLQYDLGEGPCLEAMRQGRMFLVPDLRHEQRWPRYTSAALKAGVRAQMGVPLAPGDTPSGVLNFYGADPADPTDLDEAAELAGVFATHAALALAQITLTEHLNVALSSRKVIGQAIGIVMERYQLGEERAFDFLVRVSGQTNVKLRDVARDLVMEADARVNDKKGESDD